MSQLDFLTDVYENWIKGNGLPLVSADDLLYQSTGNELSLRQRVWLSSFIETWDTIQMKQRR